MIVKRKDGYYVVSRLGKNLGGPYEHRSHAIKRLQQVEYFKKHGECGLSHSKKKKKTSLKKLGFESKAQQRYMFATHPRIAKKMAKDHEKRHGKGSIKDIPERDNNGKQDY